MKSHSDFKLCYTSWPYPAYEIFMFYLPYLELMESAEEIAFDPDWEEDND